MFSNRSQDADVKLIDFGLSQKFARNEHLKDAVGTVYTMAPELLAGDYGPKVDVWSIGVIGFMLLSSSMPFYGKDRVHVIRKIIQGKFSFSSRRWKNVSPEAKAFVRELLELDPRRRPTADSALQMSWMDNDQTESAEFQLEKAMDNVQANIQAFAEYSKLKKLALMVIAYKSTSDEIGMLKRMFGKFDKLKNGEITMPEFKQTLSEYYDYTDEEMERMFEGIDIDGTGSVHYSEFLAATMESHGSIDEERLAEAFDRIDSDDTGYITVDNLRDFLGENIPTSYLEAIIDEADLTRDHRISYEEFLELWNGESDSRLAYARQHVHGKRIESRENSFDSRLNSHPSFVSSMSSSDDVDAPETMTAADGTQAVVNRHKKRDRGSGTTFFQMQKKEVSLRGQWV